MTDTHSSLLLADRHSSQIRLRTLIGLRWIAVAGQIAALGVANRLFHLSFDLGWCTFAIGLSVIANLISIFVFPQNKRLNEYEATLMLLFDTAQLSLLLFLTGGLHNPFTILILAPVAVAATALPLRAALIIGASAIALVSVLSQFHIPLRTEMGYSMRMPEIFVFGVWAAVVVTIVFLGLYSRRISTEMQSMSQALLATQMALAREQKLTDLGGVVAAAAHELGTPLATITLVSSELDEELSDLPDLRDDARLIREQADRCRDILRSMGKAGKDDRHLKQALLSAVVEEAAEPHSERGKSVVIDVGAAGSNPYSQPVILRRPEIVHGLRNLIQNAVDFAASTVWVDISWSDSKMCVRIVDDGPGYASDIIGRIGDPFLRRRKARPEQKVRDGYHGMGLGLFIAKTLLERTGAELNFANGSDSGSDQPEPGTRSGAIVQAIWPRGPNGIEAQEKTPVLAENVPFAS